jgi:hypothetical protein
MLLLLEAFFWTKIKLMMNLRGNKYLRARITDIFNYKKNFAINHHLLSWLPSSVLINSNSNL